MDENSVILNEPEADDPNTWVNVSWKKRTEALERENLALRARIEQLERNGRRDL